MIHGKKTTIANKQYGIIDYDCILNNYFLLAIN